MSEERAARARSLGWVAGALALAILLWGGYSRHWSWTGFARNDSLWDWLQLLLLPVAVAALPLWLRHRERMDPRHRRLIAATVLAFVGLVLAGYLVPMVWTGFPGNTVWDWLQLVVLPLVVVAVPLWGAISSRLRPHHRVALWAAPAALALFVVGGYAFDWSWTGFRGNTLWDWLQLLLVPLVFPTLLVPAAVAYLGQGIEEDRPAGGQPRRAPAPAGARSLAAAPRGVLVALVALGAGTALGSQAFARHERERVAAAAARPACDARGALVVAADASTRVLRDGRAFSACRAGGPLVALASRGAAPGPVHFQLSGSRVVFADEACQAGTCSAAIKVLRLGRDARPFVRHRFHGGAVAGIAVSPLGALAVMLRGAAGGPRVYLLDARGTTLADAGPQIDPASLAGAGSTVYWRRAGRAASARFVSG